MQCTYNFNELTIQSNVRCTLNYPIKLQTFASFFPKQTMFDVSTSESFLHYRESCDVDSLPIDQYIDLPYTTSCNFMKVSCTFMKVFHFRETLAKSGKCFMQDISCFCKRLSCFCKRLSCFCKRIALALSCFTCQCDITLRYIIVNVIL